MRSDPGRAAGRPVDTVWNARKFRREAGPFRQALLAAEGRESARQAVLELVNRLHFETYGDSDSRHPLDRVVVRDCARAWRGLLHPRSERLAGFSLLEAMIDGARRRERPDISPAFWAEIIHLVWGILGRVRLHQSVQPADVGRASGRRLDLLGLRMNDWMERYPDGVSPESVGRRQRHRDRILARLGADTGRWEDWRWQVRHIARSAGDLDRMAGLDRDERDRITAAVRWRIPFGVTPYYASLFDDSASAGPDRAIRAQVIPPRTYLEAFAEAGSGPEDFMGETETSPVGLVTRRYAGIAILKPYNSCPQICVYCQRNWEIKGPLMPGALASRDRIAKALEWLAAHPAIHEVLVTGGDPLMMSDATLKRVLAGIARIPHIERIRIGSRTPVTLPMRLTGDLCRLLASFRAPGRREVCLVTHVQHPYEVTPELVAAVTRLRDHGIPVYNQLVFTFYISRRFEAAALRRLLRRCGIDPYYTFYPKGKNETEEYRVPIARLLQEQKEEARLLPGMARTDEPVYNLPRIGKNDLNAWQNRDLISVRPDGSRVFEFHPWEKQIAPQRTYVGDDVPILDYLKRLESIGEMTEEYESIWYYY